MHALSKRAGESMNQQDETPPSSGETAGESDSVVQASVKKNALYNILKTLSTIVFPLITFPYISRVLQPEAVGMVNFGSSIVSYASLIATLGITAYAVRECAKVRDDREELGKLASQLISINICTAAIAYMLLAISLLFAPTLNSYQLLISIQSISILFTVLGADWLNTAMEDFRYITLRTFAFQLLSLVMMFLFVHQPEHYLIYAIIGVISSSGASVLNIVYRRKFCKTRFTLKMDWKKHFPKIVLLFTMIVSQTIMNNLDITMLGFIKGDYEVGLYSTAAKLTSIITQVVASVAWVLMPRLSYQYEHGSTEDANRLINNAFSFTAAVGLPLIVAVNLMADETILIIGGEKYLGAVTCCRILTIYMAMGFMSNIYGNMILLPTNNEKYFTWTCVAACIFNAIANAFFIPLFGIEGAAITTGISSTIVTIGTHIACRKKTRYRLSNVKSVLRGPVIGSTAIAIVCILGKVFIPSFILRFISVVLVSIIAYAVILILAKDSFAEEMMMPVIRRVAKRRP